MSRQRRSAPKLTGLDVVEFFRQRSTANEDTFGNCIDAIGDDGRALDQWWSDYKTATEARAGEARGGPRALRTQLRRGESSLVQSSSVLEEPSEIEEPLSENGTPGDGSSQGVRKRRLPPQSFQEQTQEGASKALRKFEAQALKTRETFDGLPDEVKEELVATLPYHQAAYISGVTGVDAYVRDILDRTRQNRSKLLGPNRTEAIDEVTAQGVSASTLKALAMAQMGLIKFIGELRRHSTVATDIPVEVIQSVAYQTLPAWFDPYNTIIGYIVPEANQNSAGQLTNSTLAVLPRALAAYDPDVNIDAPYADAIADLKELITPFFETTASHTSAIVVDRAVNARHLTGEATTALTEVADANVANFENGGQFVVVREDSPVQNINNDFSGLALWSPAPTASLPSFADATPVGAVQLIREQDIDPQLGPNVILTSVDVIEPERVTLGQRQRQAPPARDLRQSPPAFANLIRREPSSSSSSADFQAEPLSSSLSTPPTPTPGEFVPMKAEEQMVVSPPAVSEYFAADEEEVSLPADEPAMMPTNPHTTELRDPALDYNIIQNSLPDTTAAEVSGETDLRSLGLQQGENASISEDVLQKAHDWVHPYGAAGDNNAYDLLRVSSLSGAPSELDEKKFSWTNKDLRDIFRTMKVNVDEMSNSELLSAVRSIALASAKRYNQRVTPDALEKGWNLITNMAQTSRDVGLTQNPDSQTPAPEVLANFFESALHYIGKGDGITSPRHGVKIFEASDPQQFAAWRETPAGKRAFPSDMDVEGQAQAAYKVFFKLCGAVDAPQSISTGLDSGFTAQSVITQDFILDLLTTQDRRPFGFRTWFAVSDDADENILGFMQTADLRDHAKAVLAKEAAPMYLQLRTNENLFPGDSQLPPFHENEIIEGAQTQLNVNQGDEGVDVPNRLARTLYVEYVCARADMFYQGRLVQIVDMFEDINTGRSMVLILDPNRPLDPSASVEERLEPIAVERRLVTSESSYAYVSQLLFLYVLLHMYDQGFYGLMLTVSPKPSKDLTYLFSEEQNTARGQQGQLQMRDDPDFIRKLGSNIFDSTLVSMYERYWRLERAIPWKTLTRDSGLLWLQEKRPKGNTTKSGTISLQAYTASVPSKYNGQEGIEHALMSTIYDEQTQTLVRQETDPVFSTFEELSPSGVMYRPYPTLKDLQSFIASLGSTLIQTILEPVAPLAYATDLNSAPDSQDEMEIDE